MKRGVMKHERQQKRLYLARHRPPPCRLIFPNIVQLVASSARTLHASASRFTPQPTTARQLTLPLVLPPPHQPLPPPSGPGRHATPLPSSPATAGPRYPLLLSAAPPYLTRPLPLVHHSFHFLLLALPDTFLCPRVRPGCRTRCNSPPLAAHQTLQSETGALLRPSLPPRHRSPHRSAPPCSARVCQRARLALTLPPLPSCPPCTPLLSTPPCCHHSSAQSLLRPSCWIKMLSKACLPIPWWHCSKSTTVCTLSHSLFTLALSRRMANNRNSKILSHLCSR